MCFCYDVPIVLNNVARTDAWCCNVGHGMRDNGRMLRFDMVERCLCLLAAYYLHAISSVIMRHGHIIGHNLAWVWPCP